MQTAMNHRQAQETKGTRLSERKGRSWEGQFWKTVFWRRAGVWSCGGFSLAELSLGKEKIFLLPPRERKGIRHEWYAQENPPFVASHVRFERDSPVFVFMLPAQFPRQTASRHSGIPFGEFCCEPVQIFVLFTQKN